MKLNNRRTRMIGNTRYLSILTQNVNGPNAPIQRQRIANWNKKKRPNDMLLTKDSPNRKKNKHWLRIKELKKVLQAN
jgi:hypothetical protein